jgi:hypothetical protein
VIEVRIAHDERTEDRGDEREVGQDHLYAVLAALPLVERVELIERMAERMGV